MRASLLAALLLLGVPAVGCAATSTEEGAANDEIVGDSEDAVVSGGGPRTVSLRYEGTCDFLRSCSSWSRGLPAGTARWGCPAENRDHDGNGSRDYGTCSDSELWVAGPTRAYCGKTARICRGEVCVNARVKDVSVSQHWEGSNGVFDALNLSYGLTGRCSGYGGGRVTVSAN
jgi:hypothetical protein